MDTVLCSDPKHPAFRHLQGWCKWKDMKLCTQLDELTAGRFLYLISCTQLVPADVRKRFERVFVVHESDLPLGRGWSPLAWQIIEGKNEIPLTLIEAADRVDAGPVWGKSTVRLEGHELAPEIHEAVTRGKINLIESSFGPPQPQEGEATYYRRRTPEDSRIDPHKSIAAQFDLLRICEPRFPAFFEYRGQVYEITITKRED